MPQLTQRPRLRNLSFSFSIPRFVIQLQSKVLKVQYIIFYFNLNMLLSPFHAIFTIPCNTMAPSAIRQHFLQHEMKDKPYDKVNDNCQEWVLTFLNKISGNLVKKIAKTNSKDSRWETSYFPNGSEKSFYRRHRVKLQYHVDEICSVPLLPVFLRKRITCVCCCACH